MNLNKKYGPFTGWEWMGAGVFTSLVGAFVLTLYLSAADGNYVVPESNITFGINGMTETRCINGFKFIVGERGHVQQMLNENGGGVKCGSQ